MLGRIQEITQSGIAARRFNRLFERAQNLLTSGKRIYPKLVTLRRWHSDSSILKKTYSFVAEIEESNQIGTGIGTAEFEITAAQKAISEAYERLIYRLTKKSLQSETSNGWAAHASRAKAFSNARYELLERDTILVQWLRKQPFIQVDVNDILMKLPSTTRSGRKFSVRAALLSTEGFISTISLIAQDHIGRTLTSNSGGRSLESALGKAAVELDRVLKYAEIGVFDDALTENEAGKVLKHSVAYMYGRPFPDWPFGKSISFANAEKLWRSEANTSFMPILKCDVIADGDLFVVRSGSEHLQQLYFGPTEIARANGGLNYTRLATFNLNYEPHICS